MPDDARHLDVRVYAHDWPRAHEGLELCYAVLLEPFGVPRDAPWDRLEPGAEHIAAIGADTAAGEAGPILGYARLLPADEDGWAQLRQVAVTHSLRGLGIGRRLVQAAETRACELGARGLWLNARLPAVGFYERLGYEVFSGEFITGLANLPHVKMRRRLGA